MKSMVWDATQSGKESIEKMFPKLRSRNGAGGTWIVSISGLDFVMYRGLAVCADDNDNITIVDKTE